MQDRRVTPWPATGPSLILRACALSPSGFFWVTWVGLLALAVLRYLQFEVMKRRAARESRRGRRSPMVNMVSSFVVAVTDTVWAAGTSILAGAPEG